MNDADDEMSFPEKSAWVSLLAVLIVYSSYFAGVVSGTAEHSLSAMLYSSIGVVIALVVIEVILQSLLAMMAPADANAPEDERDRLVCARAARISLLVLNAGVVLVIVQTLISGAMSEAGRGEALSQYVVVNLLLFAVVLAESVRYGARGYFYRRGVFQ